MSRFQQILIVLTIAARAAAAQNPMPGADLPTDGQGPVNTRLHGMVATPVVLTTPALGTGAGGTVAWQFQLDSSRGSSVGLGGIYSTSNSWMFAVGSRVLFHDSRREGVGGFAIFDARYDFFGVGYAAGNADHSVPIKQRGDAEVLEFLGTLPAKVYLGPRYYHRGLTTSLNGQHPADPLTPLVQTNDNYNISSLGLALDYDSRDNDWAPHHGNLTEASVMFAEQWLASDFSYPFSYFAVNQYFALTGKQVLALRLVSCNVGSNAPVWEDCLFGTQNDLRGYSGGRYRDASMFAGQAELRTPIYGRFGGAVFAGVGGVAPGFMDYIGKQLLPSGGFGLRYLESRTHHTTIGVDYAWGRNHGAFYLRVGEAY